LFLFLSCDRLLCVVCLEIREAEKLDQIHSAIAKPTGIPPVAHPPPSKPSCQEPRTSFLAPSRYLQLPHESESVAIHHHPDRLGTCISPPAWFRLDRGFSPLNPTLQPTFATGSEKGGKKESWDILESRNLETNQTPPSPKPPNPRYHQDPLCPSISLCS